MPRIRLIEKARFSVVTRRYHQDRAYAQWTNGKVTAARWLARNIRTIKDIDRAYIVDHHDGGKQYSLDEFRLAFPPSRDPRNG